MSGEVRHERDGSIVTLTLSNPEKRNALTYEMYDRLVSEFQRIGGDRTVRAVVLRGAGGSFAGGTDIRHLTDITTGEDGVAYEAYMRRVQVALLDLRIPVVAVVSGACVGGGLVLAALSDLVYCTPDARFGSPIAFTIGNTLSPTSLARLYECLGRRRTTQMLLAGRFLTGREALDAGFVTAVAEEDGLETLVADALAAILEAAPLSIRSFKEFERRLDASATLVKTDDVYAEIYASSDFHEGVASFLGHRKPAYTGR